MLRTLCCFPALFVSTGIKLNSQITLPPTYCLFHFFYSLQVLFTGISLDKAQLHRISLKTLSSSSQTFYQANQAIPNLPTILNTSF